MTFAADNPVEMHLYRPSRCGRTTTASWGQRLQPADEPIRWTVDYVYAGTKLLAAVRPAVGRLDTLTVVKSGSGGVSARPAGIDCGPACTARYLDGTSVTLTAVAAQGFVFGGWSGACSGTSASATVTMGGDASCTATFTALYTLQVTKNGPGTVTSAPAGIACGDACSATYTAGTVVTLTATPASGYVFVAWSGTGCATGTVQMSQARTCTGDLRPSAHGLGAPEERQPLQGRAVDEQSGGHQLLDRLRRQLPQRDGGESVHERDALVVERGQQHAAVADDGQRQDVHRRLQQLLRADSIGAQTPTTESATESTLSAAPQPERRLRAASQGPRRRPRR